MKKNSVGQSSKILLIVALTALFALAAGVGIKAGLASFGVKAGGDAVAQAQQPNNPPAAPVVKPTLTLPAASKSQYLPEAQSQQARGIKFTVSNFRANGDHDVLADVCYDLPGQDVWDINAATLTYGTDSTGNFAVTETSIHVAKDSSMKGFRCLTLDFYDVKANANLSALTLSIENIGQISPAEGHECEGYLARIKSNANLAKAGVEAACEQSPNGAQVKLAKKPQSLSEEDANALISQAMYNQVNGPWVFAVTQNK